MKQFYLDRNEDTLDNAVRTILIDFFKSKLTGHEHFFVHAFYDCDMISISNTRFYFHVNISGLYIAGNVLPIFQQWHIRDTSV